MTDLWVIHGIAKWIKRNYSKVYYPIFNKDSVAKQRFSVYSVQPHPLWETSKIFRAIWCWNSEVNNQTVSKCAKLVVCNVLRRQELLSVSAMLLRRALSCDVLHCLAISCTACVFFLHCLAISCTVLRFPALSFSMSCTACVVLHCLTMSCFVLRFRAMSWNVLHFLHCPALFCTVLQCLALSRADFHCLAMSCWSGPALPCTVSTVPHYPAYTILHCHTLSCSILQCLASSYLSQQSDSVP